MLFYSCLVRSNQICSVVASIVSLYQLLNSVTCTLSQHYFSEGPLTHKSYLLVHIINLEIILSVHGIWCFDYQILNTGVDALGMSVHYSQSAAQHRITTCSLQLYASTTVLRTDSGISRRYIGFSFRGRKGILC